MAQTHEPLTSERLAEMRLVIEPPATQAWRERLELLEEVDRLHAALAAAEAREAALVEVVQQVIRPPAGVDLVPVYVTPGAYRQARALLAATEAGEAEP